ncbi:glycosyltransferase [Camelliibacillus cellulosilyticus]|uniref:Glycosyltransferase n=1 Tax=Camelliibacillus cellulosilyticus TaxID=2174486 RepID=A0ABV9GTP2_9BACL
METRGFTDLFDGLRILTIGRLSHEKGQDLAITVCKRLVNDGYDIRWYCVGEGPSRNVYERLIEENHIQDHFVLLGSDPNPYAYLRQCDIYVQPSRYEGFCLTLAEALCLNKPIVTTNFTGAAEQVRHGVTGLIVNIDIHDIYNAIVTLIENRDVRETFSIGS